jgi:multiple sugar transport system ATP-binding protein
MAGVTLDHVSKVFGEVRAVNDLTIQIHDKEFLVLVGPSGCGKSTALRLIAGLEEATGGDIYIGDRRVNDVAPKDRDIAMVFQSYALYPHMTVYDNLAFGLKLRKTPIRNRSRRVKGGGEITGLRTSSSGGSFRVDATARRPRAGHRPRAVGLPLWTSRSPP